jgi:hypothetical protein
LALRVWQLEHEGRYPESLDALVPSLFALLPLDPYSGRPFGYVQSHGQPLLPLSVATLFNATQSMLKPTRPGDWLLYSVGPDLHDDRAELSFNANGQRGDLIFSLPTTPVKTQGGEPKRAKD